MDTESNKPPPTPLIPKLILGGLILLLLSWLGFMAHYLWHAAGRQPTPDTPHPSGRSADW